jgi:adenylate cyclase
MSKIILKDSGTIDKYIGDGIMAFWGAPDSMPDHPIKACLAALDCQAFVTEFNQRQKQNGKPELKTRIGINTGIAIAGNIGTHERMNYTVIGDMVNTAARLEQMNKTYHTSIIISEAVMKKIGDLFLTRPLDFTEVKGRKEKIRIFELIHLRSSATSSQLALAQEFTQAYENFYAGHLSAAREQFRAILEKFPEDYPTHMYLERLKNN